MTQIDPNDDDLRLQVRKLEHLAGVLLDIITKHGAAIKGHQESIEALAESAGLVRRSTNN